MSMTECFYFDIYKNPRVHHFRSSNVSSLTKDLENHWTSIVEDNIFIPSHLILSGNQNEAVKYNKTTILSDYIVFSFHTH